MRGKMPLKMMLILILSFAINFCLILGFQMLVRYRIAGPIDAAVLSSLDDDWSGSEILTRKELTNEGLHIYLIQQPDGSMHLVTLRKHYLLDRYRLMQDACHAWSGSEAEIQLKAGITRYTIAVKTHTSTGVHRIELLGSSAAQHAGTQFKNTMILGCTGLWILELAAWCLLFRREEIA